MLLTPLLCGLGAPVLGVVVVGAPAFLLAPDRGRGYSVLRSAEGPGLFLMGYHRRLRAASALCTIFLDSSARPSFMRERGYPSDRAARCMIPVLRRGCGAAIPAR